MVRFDSTMIVPRNAIFARRYAPDWVRDKLDRPVYETMATRWRLEDNHPDFLLQGRALASATEMLSTRDGAVSAQIADFIQASVQASERGNQVVIRLRRRLLYAILGVVVVGVALGGATVLQRMTGHRAEAQAVRRSLETELEAALAQKAHTEGMLASYQRQSAEASARQQVLEGKLEDARARLDELKAKQDKAQEAYDQAQRLGSSNLAAVRANLQKVNHDAETLADEKARLEGDLQATKTHEQVLGADLKTAKSKIDQLTADVDQSKGQLNKEAAQSADLDRQLSSLKVKIADVTTQLSDVQSKYSACVTQLSNASRELDTTKSKAALCETRPQP
jgi:predicted  nucleic acid-binding Zn-ribbon protein